MTGEREIYIFIKITRRLSSYHFFLKAIHKQAGKKKKDDI